MISVSVLNIKDDKEKIKEVDNLNTDYIHIDIMDGEFVTNKVDMLDLPKLKTKRDVHLMVHDVKKYIDDYKKYNPEFITFHYEANVDIREIINYIRSLDIKVGLSIKPGSKVSDIEEYLDELDLVLVMSVEPGKGGQSFIPESVDKIEELKELREKNNYHYLIEVDGGINKDTCRECVDADILVVGSYITMSDNYNERLKSVIL
jgi:ribulose-phosphate 3-epimerase